MVAVLLGVARVSLRRLLVQVSAPVTEPWSETLGVWGPRRLSLLMAPGTNIRE